ncbi:MAG TPA: flagellar hook-associated protein FlgK [Tepidisphaeraceae bacterium]|nr:flagellar hook-associated protein FlgK [Tepidisphaeraceae bacterium]
MSLSGALNVGRSALSTHQVAIQVTSNNIANVNTPGYTRQTAKLAALRDQRIGPDLYVGTGVGIDSITRAIDASLNGRLRASTSDGEAADVIKQWLGRVEATFNELSDEDLSTRLSNFFNSWSNLANKPQDIGLRQVVLQAGESVATWLSDVRGQLSGLNADVDDRIKAVATTADGLARQIADLNTQITQTEGGGGGQANGLRDQRDVLLGKLSELINIQTKEQPSGAINVFVNSEPLVTNGESTGIGVRDQIIDGKQVRTLIFQRTDSELPAREGQLGGLATVKTTIQGALDKFDSLANNLIFELNKVHSSGQGLEGVHAVQSGFAVADTTLALSNPDAGLKFDPGNGSFVVHVKNKLSGLTTSTLVQVDLDNLNGDDTTLDDLVASINGIANISANNTAGRLNIATDSDAVELSFSQDSSGILAALGVNTFFTGSDAGNIAVNKNLKSRPSLLAAAKNGEPGDNQTALAIARLETLAVAGLEGVSIKDAYAGLVNDIAGKASTAQSDAEAAASIRETLSAQREALSGVSLDEEAVNLIKSQRAFQGAARVISTVDELLQTVLALVR